MTRVLAALVALAMFMPAVAAAQDPTRNAPPGNSAIDEYLESVPSATGNEIPGPPAAGGTLTPAQKRALERLGPDGATLASVVESTSPPKRTPPAATAVSVQDVKGRSPIREVVGVAEGSGGMGPLLPAILLASALTAIALVLLRRRSHES